MPLSTRSCPVQPDPAPTAPDLFGAAAVFKTFMPYVGSALVGFVASNFAIGKRFDKAVADLKAAMVEREKVADARMARMEGALFGPNGESGIGAAVESLGEKMGQDHDLLIRLATTVDGLRDTVRAVDTSVRAALTATRPTPGANP